MSDKTYEEYELESTKFQYLEGYGVDNWNGYSEAIKDAEEAFKETIKENNGL